MGGLTVRGGRGGVEARTQDMERHAATLDALGNDVAAVARATARRSRSGSLISTTPLAPTTAFHAEVQLLDVAARTGMLAVRVEATARRLRLTAELIEAADVWPDRLRAAAVRELAPITTFAVVGVSIVAAADGALGGAARHLPLVGGPTGDASVADSALDGAADASLELLGRLLQTTPWIIDSAVHAGPELVGDVRGRRVDRQELLATMLGVGADRWGYLVDLPIDVERLPGPGRQAPQSPDELVGRMIDLMQSTRDAPDGSVVAVTRVVGDDGDVAWIVEVPGTQEWGLSPGGDPSDLTTNAQLAAFEDARFLDAVDEALQAAGALSHEPVLLSGHSQGGIVATAFASQAEQRGYNVTAVLTLGSPVADLDVGLDVTILSVEHTDDLVPRLDGGANLDQPHHATVTASSGTLTPLAPISPHSLGLYRATLDTALAAGDPSVDAWSTQVEAFFDGRGERLLYALRRPHTEAP